MLPLSNKIIFFAFERWVTGSHLVPIQHSQFFSSKIQGWCCALSKNLSSLMHNFAPPFCGPFHGFPSSNTIWLLDAIDASCISALAQSVMERMRYATIRAPTHAVMRWVSGCHGSLLLAVIESLWLLPNLSCGGVSAFFAAQASFQIICYCNFLYLWLFCCVEIKKQPWHRWLGMPSNTLTTSEDDQSTITLSS